MIQGQLEHAIDTVGVSPLGETVLYFEALGKRCTHDHITIDHFLLRRFNTFHDRFFRRGRED